MREHPDFFDLPQPGEPRITRRLRPEAKEDNPFDNEVVTAVITAAAGVTVAAGTAMYFLLRKKKS